MILVLTTYAIAQCGDTVPHINSVSHWRVRDSYEGPDAEIMISETENINAACPSACHLPSLTEWVCANLQFPMACKILHTTRTSYKDFGAGSKNFRHG